MTNPEWGRKRICHACGAMFYDMRRDPIVCPKCDTKFDPEAILKSRRARVPAAKGAVSKAVAPEEAEAEDEVKVGPEKDESEIEKDETEPGIEKDESGIETDETEPGIEKDEPGIEKDEPEIEKDETEPDKEETLLEDTSGLTEDDDDVAEVREHLDKDEPSS